jgi:hypothetical protein
MEGGVELRSLFGSLASKKRNGGSPRIHAGELGFQAERLAQDYFPPASAAGFRNLLSHVARSEESAAKGSRG